MLSSNVSRPMLRYISIISQTSRAVPTTHARRPPRPHGLLYQLVEQLALVAPLHLRELDGVPLDRAADLRFGPASLHSPFFTTPSPEDTITPPYLLRWHFKQALS
jgi:hypothetical protein